jgi:hypothetical protein
MNITYKDWTDCKNILAHIVHVPATNTTSETQISIGVRIEPSAVCVITEVLNHVAGVTSDMELSMGKFESDFAGRPSAHFERRPAANLQAAIGECDKLKADIEAKVARLVEADRAAFERSLSGA